MKKLTIALLIIAFSGNYELFSQKTDVIFLHHSTGRMIYEQGAIENASRTKEFADWVKHEWLSENGSNYDNIHVFDYFSLAAETDPNAKKPNVPYCLKYEYEKAHDQNDSHPNELACREIGPEFYAYIINLLEDISLRE